MRVLWTTQAHISTNFPAIIQSYFLSIFFQSCYVILIYTSHCLEYRQLLLVEWALPNILCSVVLAELIDTLEIEAQNLQHCVPQNHIPGTAHINI